MKLIGYFPSYSIHAMQYQVAGIPADRLNYVIYAFASVSATGDCVSVNADDDKINFAQLLQMKQQYPGVQTLISIGGASNSTNFPAAVANPTILAHFVQSCLQFMKQNGFDGIDIDWEYPSSAQAQSFTALLTELKRQLDSLGGTDKRKYLLSIAAPAGNSNYSNLQLNLIHPNLDWINLMAYDFTVVSSNVTDLVAPLVPYDPSVQKHAASNVDAAVQAYLKAGVPAAKLVLGTRFVGTGWQGVADANNGLYQANKGAAKGTWDAAGAAPTGSFGYQDLKQNYIGSYSRFWHAEAEVPWLFNPAAGVMISYEDLQSLTIKSKYAIANQLGGVTIWNLASDDAQHSLVNLIAGTIAPPANATASVAGQIAFDHGLPATGLSIRIYSLGFGGADTLLGVGQTDSQGNYSLPYNPGGASVNLELRAVDAQGNEIALSQAIYNAAAKVTLNLVAPASLQPLAPEFQRLATDMSTSIGGIVNLQQAREQADRQDLRLLNQTTGWDARLLALASTAASLTQTTGLGQDVLYALLRAGLPSDPNKLSLLSSDTVQKALTKANQSGIVGFTDQQVAANVTAFQNFAAKARLNLTAIGAHSTFADFLGNSGLNSDQQSAFANLFFSQSSSADGLWQKAATLNIPAATLSNLKLQGKLAYLTFNNAAVVQKLQTDLGSLDNLSQLPEKDLHTDAAWQTYLTAIAGAGNTQALDTLIPPAYQGSATADRLQAYSADLARKVRLSFPTQVAARMVEAAELSVGASNTADMTAVLKNAAQLGFRLGRTPLNSFIQKNQTALFQGVPASGVTAAMQSLKTLHRLYQITPSSESLQAATKTGFTSAHDAASFSHRDFLRHFGNQFPSLDEAALFHRKAQQVSSVTFNLLAAAQSIDTAPAIQSISPAPAVRQSAKAALVEQFPDMQSLFGSLDYCDCPDCRSVLSPAAYLVDILRFLDPAAIQWNAFLAEWQVQHNGKNYTDSYLKPYDALVLRRPDLPNLPLTCENTNTVLPYIDVVNEILEYYIVNGKLDAGAAYDTGEAASADLLAEPQNILPPAYATLYGARYPLGLPFDLWIETVRAFLGYFQTPLSSILEIFRPATVLELFTDANHYPYYRAAIFAELLGFSPAEYAVLTDSNALGDWFQLYGYPSQAAALSALKSAKTLSQTLGVSYQDLVNIVSTGFINPQLNTLVALQKLGVQPADIFSYEGQSGYTPMTAAQKTAFEALLDSLTKQYNPANSASGFNARTWLSTTWTGGGFNQIVLLFDANPGCDFAGTVLQYANGTAADAPVFIRLNLFVRLWKKLGWTLQETDRALQAFLSPLIPLTSDAAFGADFAAAMKTALVYLAHLQTLNATLEAGPWGRAGLLPIWSNLSTTGSDSLYAQLFLNPSVLQNDPIFDDPVGNYLSAGSIFIKDHLPALQGALHLSSNEVALILTDAGLDVATAALSLANISLLYRYALLAAGLQLSVSDFLALKGMSGYTPFAALSAKPLAVLADDIPLTQTLALVEQAGKVKTSSFSIADLNYLLRHRFDLVGKYCPDQDAVMQLVRSVSNSIHLIQSGNAVPTDPLTFTDTVIKQKLALVFPSNVVQTFMGMWTGSIQYIAVQTGVVPANQLDPAKLAQFPTIQVSYDSVQNAQHLTSVGVLTTTEKSQIEAADNSPVLAALLNAVDTQARTFFQTYLEVSSLGQTSTGFLPAADFDALFAPTPAGTSDAPKRQELAQTFLPFLQQSLISQAVVQALASDLGADPSLVQTLLTNPNLLSDPSQAGATLLDAFAAAAQSGIAATYFASTDGSGAVLKSGTALSADTADAQAPKPGGASSAHFEGYLEVSSDGPFRFFAEMGKQNAQVELQFDFLANPLLLSLAAADATEVSQFVELKGGIPYHFTFDAHNLGGGDASLLVQGESFPKGPLSQLTLYPESAVIRFTRARVLLSKTLQIVQSLNLTEREVTYLLANGTDFNNLSFSALPTQPADDSPAHAAVLFGQFLRLVDYAALKQGPAGGSDGLIDVFESARQTLLASANLAQSTQTFLRMLYQTVADLTRRDVNTVAATAQQLGFTTQNQVAAGQLLLTAPDFTQEKGLGRLWNALQAVQTTGIPVASLAAVTGIIDTTKTQDARFALAGNLKSAVKAYYTPDVWRPIAKSIFDPLRQKKRDALCAYLLNQLGLQNTEQLFEFFLVDPGMEPVVTTSRLRLALSSVQTFIQRCFLNLEAKVAPSALDSSQWDWMKRYRVWQANREIFLWPENWMIPELRLDKTDLFQALESALLQGDITNDLAEDVLLTYLKGLDERARLDILTMYLDQTLTDPGSNTLHVVGRNHGKPQKFFYRRFAFQAWTAWEPVTVDIEGDHLAAVVWQDRLHLFWLTFAPVAPSPPLHSQAVDSDPTTLGNMPFGLLATKVDTVAPQKQVKIQLHYCEYLQGKWSDRKSSDLTRAEAYAVESDFDPSQVYIHVSKEYDDDGNEGSVRIHLSYNFWDPIAFRLLGRNSEPEMAFRYGEDAPPMPYTNTGFLASKYSGSGTLQVNFTNQIQSQDGRVIQTSSVTNPILQQGTTFTLLVCDNAVTTPLPTTDPYLQQAAALSGPFFYEDVGSNTTLFVDPSLTETTLDEWDRWVIPHTPPDTGIAADTYWDNISLVAQLPSVGLVNLPDPASIYKVKPPVDWATDPATAISFGTSLIGKSGSVTASKIAGLSAARLVTSTTLSKAAPASRVSLNGSRLNTVGTSGLSLGTLQRINTVRSAPAGAAPAPLLVKQLKGGLA